MSTLEITSVSTKGQVIIPAVIRRELGIHAGSKLMVLTDGANLLMKPLSPPKKETFKKLISKSRKLAKSVNMKESELSDIIKQARNESSH